jgi:hypothetical protein
MKIPKDVNIIKDAENEVPFEIMEQTLVKIGDSMRKIDKTRVSRKLIVTLIQDDTKLRKGTIETVLNSFQNLENKYLKKKG